MIKVNKADSMQWLDTYKANYKSKNGISPKYEDLTDVERRELRRQLALEQGWICCYCMKRITLNTSRIEHFKPRSKYPNESLNYENLFASCNGEKNAPDMDNHCDIKKDDWFDERMISPASAEVENIFHYRIDGEVIPGSKRNSEKIDIENQMIKHLGLNEYYLQRNRQATIENSELFDDVEYSEADWMGFILYYQTKHDDKLEEYCGAIIDLMKAEIYS